MALPNEEFKKIKVYPNEYIDNITVNRPLGRLLENDKYLERLTSNFISGLVYVESPLSVTSSGEVGQVAIKNNYFYVYNPISVGTNWGRFQLDYSW